MVQTIAVAEAALMDSMMTLAMEDPDHINVGTNWWHPRIKVLEKWLREDANKAAIPDDGAEEMIRKHIQRGDIYTQSQLKCWKHILLELSDIPGFTVASCGSEGMEGVGQTSPSRGKLRPGKELIILSDEMNQEPVQDAVNEVLSASPQRTLALTLNASGSASTKKFANLSMMERQAEWLRKKQEKLAAEKQRQDEEKDKELTFQPKLIRRSTFNTDKLPVEEKQPPSARPVVRSESFGVNKASETAATQVVTSAPATETRRPPSGNVNVRRGSAKPGKKKKFIPVDQRLEIQSNLLDSMKSELVASMQMSSSALATTASDSENNNSSTMSRETATPEGPDASLAAQAAEADAQPAVELQSWSDRPFIHGFRVDFDSSDTKARLVIQDASKFELSSMYRKTDRKAQREGVALHMGRREDTYEEEVIAILFDKEKVSESEAAKWWKDHEHRFSHFIRDRSSTAANDALHSAVAALTGTPS